MNLLITPVAVVLIGLFVRSRLSATLLYLVIEAIVFTFQTLLVFGNWLAGGLTIFGDGMFGPPPTGLPLVLDESWSYGLVNLVIMSVGVVLTNLIVGLRNRGRARRDAVDVDLSTEAA